MFFTYTIAFPKTNPRPYLDVVLKSGLLTTNKLVALVDSGADYPIFPVEAAMVDLRLDLTKAEKWYFSGTTGVLQEAKLAKVSLIILKENNTVPAYEVDTICAFCDTLKMAGGGVLGQKGFFSLFKTTFYQPNNRFEIERWDEIGAG